jgi:hypothetical protein
MIYLNSVQFLKYEWYEVGPWSNGTRNLYMPAFAGHGLRSRFVPLTTEDALVGLG